MKKAATILALAFAFLVADSFFAVMFQTAQANPFSPEYVYHDIRPPEGAQAPVVSIKTPQNNSFHPKDVTLTYEVITPKDGNQSYGLAISELYYKCSWKREITVISKNKYRVFPDSAYSIDLSDVQGGNLSVTVYAIGTGLIWTGSEELGLLRRYVYYDRFVIGGYSTVSFVKDLVPPWVSVMSPQNTTYTTPDVKLDFTVNEDSSQILYSLDNSENQTTSGNATLTGLPNGDHSVTLYVFDQVGNAASPKTILFNVDSPEPFPTATATVAVISPIAVCAGLLIYSKKRNGSRTAKATI